MVSGRLGKKGHAARFLNIDLHTQLKSIFGKKKNLGFLYRQIAAIPTGRRLHSSANCVLGKLLLCKRDNRAARGTYGAGIQWVSGTPGAGAEGRA